MIARLWHGLTSRENAGAYETLLRNKVLPGIHRVSGYGGAYLLKRTVPEGVGLVPVPFSDRLTPVARSRAPTTNKRGCRPAQRRLPRPSAGASVTTERRWGRDT